MTDAVECCVIGAGVVGLAVARQLAMSGREVLVLEREPAVGSGVSSRNSEVIHAGIYYPEGSLKARMCVHGKHLLYDFCDSHGVAYSRCEKLIVGCDDSEAQALRAIHARGLGNGVSDLRLITQAEARALEPAVRCEAAILSPSTGIIDSHGLMLALQGDLEDRGGMIAFNTDVTAGTINGQGFEIETTAGDRLHCRILVNASSLNAPTLAMRISGLPAHTIPKAYYSRGRYFRCVRNPPITRLIYPVPVAAWLGIHLTLDLTGQCRFGPDTQWVDEPDYLVDPAAAGDFYEAIRRYWPDLEDGMLVPDYAGVRPKIYGPGEDPSDFVISGPQAHGVPGLVNLFGIESPGLTSCLAIAEYTAGLVSN